MATLIVHPSGVEGSLKAPPNKSYTHRAALLSMIIPGESKIYNPLLSRDTCASIRTAEMLGGRVVMDGEVINIEGHYPLKMPENVIDVENSGTTMRLVSALSAHVEDGYTVLTGDASIRERPMQPLLSALKELGVECYSTRINGLPPIVVRGGGMRGGDALLEGDISSQFVTALLLSTPFAEKNCSIEIVGQLVSSHYVDMTLEVLRNASIHVEEKHGRFMVPAPQTAKSLDFRVPGDLGLSAFLFALAALTRSSINVEGFDFTKPQSDLEILKILADMGCEVKVGEKEGTVGVQGGGLEGGEFSLRDSPDLLPVVAVLGAKAKGKTVVEDVRHARFKESDRISRLAEELPKLGVRVREREDGLEVEGKDRLKGCKLDAHGDHRLFMAFVVAAAAASEPCEVEGLETVSISYPSFIEDIEGLGMKVEEGSRRWETS